MRTLIGILFLALAGCASGALSPASVPVQASSELTGADIIALAHDASGGDVYTNVTSLKLTGYNLIHTPNGDILWDDYKMWRVFAGQKNDAHRANGKVRIEANTDSERALLLSFDGTFTYNQNGKLDDQSANAMWGANFGFGAIRHALDEGWTQTRKPDRLIDGEPSYVVTLSDPAGGETLFGIRHSDFATVYVGFDTPKGWHERYYSSFFSKPESPWVQSGRVQLFYNGVMANQAFWTDFEIDQNYSEELFVIDTD